MAFSLCTDIVFSSPSRTLILLLACSFSLYLYITWNTEGKLFADVVVNQKKTKMDPESVSNLKAFPPAEAGMVRYALHMPKSENEDLIKVELKVGKTIETKDSQNMMFFGGQLEEVNLEGWGYTYLVLKEIGQMASSRMMPDPNAPMVKRFVTIGGEPKLLRYNSRLPYVVYVPEGVEVKACYWAAGPSSDVPQA